MIEIREPMRVSDILRVSVENRHGEKIGSIHDLIVGRDGSVRYAILSYGGFPGIGDRLIPIPFDALMSSTREGIVVLDIDKQILENAPNLESGKWPDFTEAEWKEKVDRYFDDHVVRITRGAAIEGEGPRISH